MKILVTGATGFLGRAVCERLAAAGHAVRALARSAPTAGFPAVEPVLGDIHERDSVRRALWRLHPGAAMRVTHRVEAGGVHRIELVLTPDEVVDDRPKTNVRPGTMGRTT